MKSVEPNHREVVQQTVDRLLADTNPPAERRAEERTPYFCTTVLSWNDEAERMAAYVRDVSHDGIGFFHATPIPLGELTATFMLNDTDTCLRRDDIIRLQVQIVWCRRCGEYGYISGGQLLDVVDAKQPF